MNFSESKTKEFKKTATAYVFDYEYNNEKSLLQALGEHEEFVEGSDFKISQSHKMRIKKLEMEPERIFVHITFYEPHALVPITPAIVSESKNSSNDDKEKDLHSIENYDNSHVFMIIDGKHIYTINQIIYTHQRTRLDRIFKTLGVGVKIKDKVNKSTVDKIQREKIKHLVIGVSTTMKVIDDIKIKNKLSIFEKENNSDTPFYGMLFLDHKSNFGLIESISDDIESVVNELSEDFYIVTRKDNKIKSSEIKTKKDYYTIPYGTKTIKDKYAKEILIHFIGTVV
ncbi:hypothetical protein [Xenorhabdus ishibashii]|uniref:Uncharacterized protein n=1 Tax=Xenorhabdus ishibashii TaxID=1034471 RepID=A0A2D0KCI6_9GAMM|nr:hypothetical protein [Xenorhabdus ishibashii]PHM61158.1 hypothetical protein Xish_00279 [Xenorhabdus ishibashii]